MICCGCVVHVNQQAARCSTLRWTQRMRKLQGRQAWKASCPESPLIQDRRLQLRGPLAPLPTSPIDDHAYIVLEAGGSDVSTGPSELLETLIPHTPPFIIAFSHNTACRLRASLRTPIKTTRGSR